VTHSTALYRTLRSLPASIAHLHLAIGLCLALGVPVVSLGVVQQKRPVNPKNRAPSQRSVPVNVPNPAQELTQRLQAAARAQQTNDPNAIAQANQKVIAQALRMMAELRLLDATLPQAVGLFKRSLEFEEHTDAHLQLAVAYLRLKQPRDAIEETEKVIFTSPANATAWNIKGKAWMMLRDYENGAKYLARSLALKGDMETAYSLATCFLALKQKDKAGMVFDDMVRNAGERGSLHVLFGRAYRDANYMDDAVREFKRALQVDPKTPHANYFIGLIRLIQNEWAPLPEIRDSMNAELKINPRDYLANYVLGVFASNAKEYQVSEAHLDIAAAEQPGSPEPWLYKGLNAYSQGDNQRAEELLRKAVELTGADEARSHYQIRKAYVALGRILIQSGRKEEAAVWMQKARKVQQLGMGESQQSIAEAFATKGVGMGAVMPYVSSESEEKAIPVAAADPTARLDPSALNSTNLSEKEKQLTVQHETRLRAILGSSYNDLGTTKARQRQYQPALTYFLEAERWDPNIPNLMRNIGIAALRVNNFPETVRVLSKHVEANPQDDTARGMLGIALYMTDAHAEAVKTISPLGDKVMADTGLAYAWAASLAKTGQLQEATRVLEALEKQSLAGDTWLLVGQTWNELGNHDRAILAFRKALEQNPDLPKAHYYSGIAHIKADRPADAVPEFEAELRIDPNDADAKYNLGYAYLRQTRTKDAVAMFESVIASNPSHANAHYQLGKILLEQDQVDEAIRHLETAAQLRPEQDFVLYQLQAAYRKAMRKEDADRTLAAYKELKARNRAKTLPEPTEPQ
jgi:tetratricopeptide (TPR) repeat protein